jgi:RNA polymerase sigma factor, sigma-70 family
MNNQELAKIVKQVQSNKEKYFEKLFSEIYRTIYYLSFKFLANDAEAQDISQEIILCIYNRIDELKLPEGFNNWMNRIIYTRCQNRLKQLSIQKEDDFTEVDALKEEILEKNPERVLQTKEKNEFVLKIIDDLPIKQKEVVLLYYYQQLTAPEIADILSCSLPSIQNRLYNAKRSIRERLEKSTAYTMQQLLGVGGVPILFKLLTQEANQMVTNKIKRKLWSRTQISSSRNKYKTNKGRLCFGVITVILFFYMGKMAMMLFENSKQHEATTISSQKKMESQIMESEIQDVEMMSMETQLNIIHNKSGKEKRIEELINENLEEENEEVTGNIYIQTNEKVFKQVEVQSDVTEETDWKWVLYDISQTSPKIVWSSRIEKRFTNTAVLVEKVMEDLTYEYDAGDNKKNDAVFEKEVQKKDSEMVYHEVITPQISFEKSSDINGTFISYYVQLENIGEIAAYNLVVDDRIPEYTEYIQILHEQSDSSIQVGAKYEEDIEMISWSIEQLLPTEAVTLGFQVKVKETEYQNNREINNIAYMKVMGKDSDIHVLEEDQKYLGSNEVVHRMQLQQEQIPATSDGVKESRWFVILGTVSSILIISIQMKRQKDKKYTSKVEGRKS